MYDKDGNQISYVVVKFSSTIQYNIGSCSSSLDLPVQPPLEVDKIWTIAKTETAWIITCNGLEVLKYLFADSTDSSCVPTWGGDVVEQIEFHGSDTASDFYNGAPGKNTSQFIPCTRRTRHRSQHDIGS